MRQKILLAFCLLIISVLPHCAPAKSSYFQEPDWSALDWEGRTVRLADLDLDYLALNVYSPDCVPCWKEIPTLNLLAREIQKNFPRHALYMVVDPYQVSVDAKEDAPWGEVYSQAKARMQKEKQDRGIEVPILFMKAPFRVKEKGLITGTPETLLLETKPLRLYYNFLGSISEESKPEVILADQKVKFFKFQFGMNSL